MALFGMYGLCMYVMWIKTLGDYWAIPPPSLLPSIPATQRSINLA